MRLPPQRHRVTGSYETIRRPACEIRDLRWVSWRPRCNRSHARTRL